MPKNDSKKTNLSGKSAKVAESIRKNKLKSKRQLILTKHEEKIQKLREGLQHFWLGIQYAYHNIVFSLSLDRHFVCEMRWSVNMEFTIHIRNDIHDVKHTTLILPFPDVFSAFKEMHRLIIVNLERNIIDIERYIERREQRLKILKEDGEEEENDGFDYEDYGIKRRLPDMATSRKRIEGCKVLIKQVQKLDKVLDASKKRKYSADMCLEITHFWGELIREKQKSSPKAKSKKNTK